MRGEMIWFNPVKGFGFIRTDDGERLPVAETGFVPGHLVGDPCGRTVVEFQREAADDAGGFRAVGVTIVPEVESRRARSRSRSR